MRDLGVKWVRGRETRAQLGTRAQLVCKCRLSRIFRLDTNDALINAVDVVGRAKNQRPINGDGRRQESVVESVPAELLIAASRPKTNRLALPVERVEMISGVEKRRGDVAAKSPIPDDFPTCRLNA